MFWWTRPLDMGCCPLWMLSLDITGSSKMAEEEREKTAFITISDRRVRSLTR